MYPHKSSKSFVLSPSLFCLVVLILLGVWSCDASSQHLQPIEDDESPLTLNRILEEDIDDVELSAARKAKCRRVCPGPKQIHCVKRLGETCQYGITEARCVNEGTDSKGHIKWRCSHNANTKKVRVVHTKVSCEGWDSPDDEYIVEGSCALEYGLQWVGKDEPLKHRLWPLFIVLIVLSPCILCTLALMCCCCLCVAIPRMLRRGGHGESYFKTDSYGGESFYDHPVHASSTRR